MVLRPLRPAGALTAAIAAVALTIVLENVVRFIFGNDLRGYALHSGATGSGAGLRIGPQQVENLVIAVMAMTAVFLFLAFTRTGKAMRAVADNPTLAGIKGINAETRGPPRQLRAGWGWPASAGCCWDWTPASTRSPASA